MWLHLFKSMTHFLCITESTVTKIMVIALKTDYRHLHIRWDAKCVFYNGDYQFLCLHQFGFWEMWYWQVIALVLISCFLLFGLIFVIIQMAYPIVCTFHSVHELWWFSFMHCQSEKCLLQSTNFTLFIQMKEILRKLCCCFKINDSVWGVPCGYLLWAPENLATLLHTLIFPNFWRGSNDWGMGLDCRIIL